MLKPMSIKGDSPVSELYFLHNNLRLSISVVYDQGNLSCMSFIREDCCGFPSQYWSEDVEMASERSFTGNWEGTSTTMYPDMTIAEPVATKHQWRCWEEHQVYYMPDGVTVSCPLKSPEGSEIVFVVNWLKSDKEMDQMSVLYNENGDFVSQTLDILNLN